MPIYITPTNLALTAALWLSAYLYQKWLDQKEAKKS